MKQNGQMQSERTAFVSNKKSGQMPLLSIHFVPNTRCEYLQPRITIIVTLMKRAIVEYQTKKYGHAL